MHILTSFDKQTHERVWCTSILQAVLRPAASAAATTASHRSRICRLRMHGGFQHVQRMQGARWPCRLGRQRAAHLRARGYSRVSALAKAQSARPFKGAPKRPPQKAWLVFSWPGHRSVSTSAPHAPLAGSLARSAPSRAQCSHAGLHNARTCMRHVFGKACHW